MNEHIKKTLEGFKQFWAGTSKKAKTLIVAGLLTIVIAALVGSILLNTKEYVVIFEGLPATENQEILAKLDEMQVDVKLDGTGAVKVLKEEESSVRMALATEGYPKSGLSYYYIEQGKDMLTTDYERKQYVNIQLQERIAASIKTLEGVKDAVVTITAPEENVFYLQEKDETTASVIIHMIPGNVLTQNQILGIQNLVAKAVPGLSKDNIALTDSQGNDLVGSSKSNSAEYLKFDLTREIEKDIKKKVSNVLEGPYDSSQFKISVTANLDTDNLVKEETIYSPSPDGDNTGVVSESAKTSESSASGTGDGGVAGTSSNAEIPIYPASSGGGESNSSSSSENYKYQVSQLKSQSQKSGAEIKSISIGIAIDKAYFDPGEKDNIAQLAAYAAGVSTGSVTVQNFVFYNDAVSADSGSIDGISGTDKKKLLYAGLGALILLLIGVIVFVLLRKRNSALAALKAAEQDEEMKKNNEKALNELFGEVPDKEIEEAVAPITPIKDARKQEIKDFAKKNPEIAAQMIRVWLKNESD